ncbi:MAG: YcxB family protein [Vampirovibrio sp.]|nr:YcxB family protein [Vampirovibrio sp.]
MAHQVSVTYTPELLKKATIRYFVRLMGRWSCCTGALASVCFALPWVPFFAGCSLTYLFPILGWIAVGLLVLFPPVIYLRVVQLNQQLLKKLDGEPLHFDFQEELVTIESSLGKSEVKWQIFDKLWIFPDLWLLFNGASNYFILPEDLLTADSKAFIRQRCDENDIPVKD